MSSKPAAASVADSTPPAVAEHRGARHLGGGSRRAMVSERGGSAARTAHAPTPTAPPVRGHEHRGAFPGERASGVEDEQRQPGEHAVHAGVGEATAVRRRRRRSNERSCSPGGSAWRACPRRCRWRARRRGDGSSAACLASRPGPLAVEHALAGGERGGPSRASASSARRWCLRRSARRWLKPARPWPWKRRASKPAGRDRWGRLIGGSVFGSLWGGDRPAPQAITLVRGSRSSARSHGRRPSTVWRAPAYLSTAWR